MVEYTGHFTREEVNEIYKKSKAGLVVFQPARNHINAQPNKLFEYMAAGLPVIASEFPLWKTIVEGENCGICVNPLDVESVRTACVFLMENDEIAESLGKNGRRAIEEKYNWNCEEEKLVSLYRELIK